MFDLQQQWKVCEAQLAKNHFEVAFKFENIYYNIIHTYIYSVLGTVESPKLLQELFNVLDAKPDFHSA